MPEGALPEAPSRAGMPPVDEFRRVAAPSSVEIERRKGSRFIGDAAPVEDAADAAAFVASIRSREPSATHHCFAWRIDARTERANDDGEPGGTAGAPILRQIDGHELQRTAVVVTRYYGGTKLGTGGLIRAYRAAAKAVLDAAEVVVRRALRRLRVEHDYELSSPVAGVLAQFGLTTEDAVYGERVSFTVAVPVDDAARFMTAMGEATAGRVSVGEA